MEEKVEEITCDNKTCNLQEITNQPRATIVLLNLLDDKIAVIFSALILGICCLVFVKDGAINVISNIVTGLFGIAVGKSISSNGNKGSF